MKCVVYEFVRSKVLVNQLYSASNAKVSVASVHAM